MPPAAIGPPFSGGEKKAGETEGEDRRPEPARSYTVNLAVKKLLR